MIEVQIDDDAWLEALPEVKKLGYAAADAALSFLPPEMGEDLGLVVFLTDDETVRDLNERFRGKDAPTNVLSFPSPPDNPEGHVGDIALAYGVCVREAAEQHKTLAAHVQHLVVHGVLHLVGYDHENDAEADEMEGLERIILTGLGVADPYQAGQGTDDGRG
ncbi:MAG TPA: rRNA maturation RNase YbeY [Phenylobacterium sp.]